MVDNDLVWTRMTLVLLTLLSIFGIGAIAAAIEVAYNLWKTSRMVPRDRVKDLIFDALLDRGQKPCGFWWNSENEIVVEFREKPTESFKLPPLFGYEIKYYLVSDWRNHRDYEWL